MKIVNIDGYTTNPGDLSWDFLNKYSDDVTVYDRTKPSDVVKRAKGAEILIINKTIINAEIIEALSPELKFIAIQSTGYNVVDLSAANEKNILVSNIPKYSTKGVAQLVLAYILSFSDNVALHSESVHNGEWCTCPDFCYLKSQIFELDNKTIGIIGFGSIGREVAKLAVAFGMNVLINTRTERDISMFKTAKYTSLDYLLENSDFVTCHCPLTPETRNLINEENISKMKKSAYFINTSRGDVVDEYALANALNNDLISGAAVDVLKKEPADPNNPLLKAKKCIITPHIAWAAYETRERLINILDENIKSYVNGTPQNIVNQNG